MDHEGLGTHLVIMKETIKDTLTNNSIVAINNGDGGHVSHPYYMSGLCCVHSQRSCDSYIIPTFQLRNKLGEVKYLALGHKNLKS